MWRKFKNRSIERVLEPSAGSGDLLLAYESLSESRMPAERDEESDFHFESFCRLAGRSVIDVCEIDVNKHAKLREMDLSVVSLDFLEYKSGSTYSHIIMNPPFAVGTQHVLHAWDILWDGEIVALVNAQTLRNPHTKEREFLSKLVDLHGSVEYVECAFVGADAARKTTVECAIVHLLKEADSSELVGRLTEGLAKDDASAANTDDYSKFHDLALPGSVVENQVMNFNAAVAAVRESIFAEARAIQLTERLGLAMSHIDGGSKGTEGRRADVAYVRKEMITRYRNLKDRAWTSILRGSQVTDMLSSGAQKQVESDFSEIKNLEFTASNIYGFLLGISQSAGDLQMSMLCEVFDSIVRYHSENAVFYRGWKSNDAQRTCGLRIKKRRFILPSFGMHSWGLSPGDQRRLADFDKVFAMLDGKKTPDYSLVTLFNKRDRDLLDAQRLTCSYFDVRYYKGIGTIHFFPRRADLMDRLNRLVGQQRAWLPNEPFPEAKGFWKQFEDAEKFDGEIRAAVKSDSRQERFYCRSALDLLAGNSGSNHGYDLDEIVKAQAIFDAAAARVQAAHGVDADLLLASPGPAQLRLAA